MVVFMLEKNKFRLLSYFDNNIEGKECVLFIHGLSCSKEVFYKQYSDLDKEFRILSIDLLGHGESENSNNKRQDYCISGFANSIIEFLNHLNIQNLNIYGWSIGGNIALEIIEKYPYVQKIILDGYSPASYVEKNFDKVFIFNDATPLISKKNITKDEAIFYVKNGGIKENQFHSQNKVDAIVNAVLRADGDMREKWFDSVMKVEGVSPKECVEKNRKKIKLLIGENDPGIQLDYLKENFADITTFFKDAGHAVFWEKPLEVNNIIRNFFYRD